MEEIITSPHTTAERIKYLMDTRNLKQVDILRMAEPYCKMFNIKLGKNDLSQYVNGHSRPMQKKLTILGLALNVSEAWLMGFDVPMERKTTPTDKEADEREQEFIALYRGLSSEKQILVVQMLRGLINN